MGYRYIVPIEVYVCQVWDLKQKISISFLTIKKYSVRKAFYFIRDFIEMTYKVYKIRKKSTIIFIINKLS